MAMLYLATPLLQPLCVGLIKHAVEGFIELHKSANKKLISTLIYLIPFLTPPLQLDRPEIDEIVLPSRPRQVTHPV